MQSQGGLADLQLRGHHPAELADAVAPHQRALCEHPADATPATPIGWRIEPVALRDTILDVHRRYRLPIIVAENR